MEAAAQGFWGPEDSSVDFCEKSYVRSPYVAEFWNSISSLIFVFLGLYGLVETVKLNARWVYPALFLTLALIGIGSTIFHGTMRWWGELWDELPMLLLGLFYVVSLSGCHSVTTGTKGVYFYSALLAFLFAMVVAYVKFKVYEIFLHSFTVLILLSLGITLLSRPKSRNLQILLLMIVGELGTAKAFWSLDHQLCGLSPVVPYFHVVWHVLAAFAGYHYVIFLLALKYEKTGHYSVFADEDGPSEKTEIYNKLWFQPFNNWERLFQNSDDYSFGIFAKKLTKALG
mmetsp:Transcript_4043/g.5395  ORF Transcript_4043/g.5395 Transcript_4043/m.5395 type:complete len:285 (+) Transcript_4043:264-1118(+)